MAGSALPLGLLYFAAVKLAGYTAAGALLNRWCRTTSPKPIQFGLARTALGLGAGIAFASLALRFELESAELAYYLALAPVRLAEWLWILWFFHGRKGAARGRLWLYALLGSLWSYLLDLPAILAVFTLPGGAWIC